ncbi:LacI family DNA-binding transcriptional regulator [Phytohabitans kaempferiae]|uniref:LacI family DNA-binding transcriptional regulator n=1 Tax=Phytohabitans kaempferiae TaxID=1620943 RepID=A0ABV6MAT2_9ACTN
MTVTIREVAQAAGVSVATVSRVLTGKDRVAEQTRRAVLQACKDLDYQPDALAASLRSGSSSSVGMLVPDITNSFFPAVVQAAEQGFAEAGLDVVFCDASNDVAVEAQRLQTLLRRRVDALLVCPVHATGSAPALRSAARSTRVAQLERRAVDELDFIGVDQRAGMSQLVRHLASSGARTAVFAGATSALSSIKDRSTAFTEACEVHGIEAWPVEDLDFPSARNGRAFTRRLVERGDLPDAIACANDDVASGVILELRDLGVRCPADVLVTGYDDVPVAALLGLTTIAQPLRDLGREVVHLLSHENGTPRQVLLAPALVVRASTSGS